MNTRQLFSLTALSLLLATGVQAQMAPATAPSAQTAPSGHLAVGVVRSVNVTARTVSIAHQDIPGMGMPAMTMSFKLDDRIPASSVKTGDTIAFVLTSTSQGTVISSVQPVAVAAGADKSAGKGMHGMPGMAQGMQGMQMMEECREMMTRK